MSKFDRSYIYKIQQSNIDPESSYSLILSMVSGDNPFILDVGCACGDMGRYLKNKRNAIVYGLEYSSESVAMAIATKSYEEVRQVDLETLSPDDFAEYKEKFDYIVCADVIEHLRRPMLVLDVLKTYLKPGGVFLVSIPNVAHMSVKANLLNNTFEYEPVGLLDETHTHLYSYKSIAEDFASIGLRIDYCCFTHMNKEGLTPHDPYERLSIAAKKQIFDDWHSYVCQYVFVARPESLPRTLLEFMNLFALQINEANAPQVIKDYRKVLLDGNADECILEIKGELTRLSEQVSRQHKVDEGLLEIKGELTRLSEQVSRQHGVLQHIENQHDVIEGMRSELVQAKSAIYAKTQEAMDLSAAYNGVIGSMSWKCTAPIRMMLDVMKRNYLLHYLFKFVKIVYHEGFRSALKRVPEKTACLVAHYRARLFTNSTTIDQYIASLEEYFNKKKFAFIDIMHVPLGWHTPLFQRFQHFSLQAKNLGGFSFYGAHPLVDKISLFEDISPGMHIFDATNVELQKAIIKFVAGRKEPKIVRIQSIDTVTTIADIEAFISQGFKVVYEYIDEITPQIVGNVPQSVWDRHDWCMRNNKIRIVATSDKLYRQATTYRADNVLMLNNGVDYGHWQMCKRDATNYPAKLKAILASKKTIVAYHGALAKWIDYSLLQKIARDGRYSLLLVGYLHDHSPECKRLMEMDNVYYIGPIPYAELNQYTPYYDVALMPFLLNDVTLSVSPVKIFEYMAAGVPIVSTALPECKKYSSCMIGRNHEEFLDCVANACEKKKDKQYMKVLRKEAKENTWLSIMKKMYENI